MESIVTFAKHIREYGVEARQQTWGYTWGEFLKYAQRGDRGEIAKENAKIHAEMTVASTREPYPTLYPGVVVGGAEACKETGLQRKNMGVLTDRARANQHRQERNDKTYRDKRIRHTG
eukprot:6213237-Pleurochrysis_carterae.AAC.1